MSLSRCISASVRSRQSIQRLLLPASNAIGGINQGDVLDTQRRIYAPTIQGESQLIRHYGTKYTAKKYKARAESSDSSDSDKEKGKKARKPKRGQTSFWRHKMRTHHQLIDLNSDGVVSWDDFEILIKRFSDLGHLSPEEIGSFTDAMRHVWEEEWGSSGDPYAFIGEEHFLAQMEHVVNAKPLRKKVASPLSYFFMAIDHDKSGEISLEEFKWFYSCLGLTDKDAEVSFAAIDINGDGKLSQKEFVKLGRKFFTTEDEAHPSKLFWGPLKR